VCAFVSTKNKYGALTLVLSISAIALTMVSGCCQKEGKLYWTDPPVVNCELPSRFELPIGRIGQLLPYWCWAATGEMIMKHYGIQRTHCEQARDEFGDPCPCPGCNDGMLDAGCNSGSFPRFEKYQLTAYARTEPLDLGEIKRELACRRSPIAFSWYSGTVRDGATESKVGHMAVVIGYVGDLISVINPLPLCMDQAQVTQDVTDESYDYYLTGGLRSGHHWEDRYAISR